MSTTSFVLPWYARWVFRAGPPLAMVAALLMSIPGEIHMATLAGWTPGYARLMPVCVSIYAASAAIVAAVSKRFALPGRKSALLGAAAALGLAVSAQTIAHLIQLDYMDMSGVLVAGVSCVPPLVVAHMLHMAAWPERLADPVECEEEESESESDQAENAPRVRRAGRRGRVGLAPEVIREAAANLTAAGQPVTARTLGEALGRSRRQAARYLPMVTSTP